MDILDATEVVFSDTFAPKPSRTLVVNTSEFLSSYLFSPLGSLKQCHNHYEFTDAPLHSVNGNVEPSCGVATFSAESQFSDRFIIWLVLSS